jgi:hypothetical protein
MKMKVYKNQWLRNKISDEKLLCKWDTNSINSDLFEIWEPRVNEFCVFFNENAESFRVARFKQIGCGSGVEGLYKDLQGNYFKNCIPIALSIEETIIHINKILEKDRNTEIYNRMLEYEKFGNSVLIPKEEALKVLKGEIK